MNRKVNLTWRYAVLALFVLATIVCGQFVPPSTARAQMTKMSAVTANGKKSTGQVLYRDSQTLALLRRDGSLAKYSALSIDQVIDLDEPFQPYTNEELEERLQKEFPRNYSVRFTDHFAVVFPSGSTFSWPSAFERLYRQFQQYFETRGIELQSNKFPMIAVVLRTRAEFDRYLEKTDLAERRSVVGFYSIHSNRIVTFDQSTEPGDTANSEINLTTIIHEATHQSAFNSGIHDRFRPLPRWVTEGLATMFEAKGVHNCIEFPGKQNRLAAEYLESLQGLIAADNFRGKLKAIICDDDLFNSNPTEAYATAWGLTYFLAENRPDLYQSYLRLTQQGKRFSAVNSQQRLTDFCSVFGDDLRDLESRIIRYFEKLQAKP